MGLNRSLTEDILLLLIKRGVTGNMSDSDVKVKKDVQVKEEDCPEEGSDFSLNTMLGVALIGAVASAGFYYIYTQLSKETKHALKDMLVGTLRNKMESCFLTGKED